MLFNERMLESYLHAKKWLKPDGMFPPFVICVIQTRSPTSGPLQFWYKRCTEAGPAPLGCFSARVYVCSFTPKCNASFLVLSTLWSLVFRNSHTLKIQFVSRLLQTARVLTLCGRGRGECSIRGVYCVATPAAGAHVILVFLRRKNVPNTGRPPRHTFHRRVFVHGAILQSKFLVSLKMSA